LESGTIDIIELVDFSVGVIFTFEMLIRIVAMGFFVGDESYLQDGWYVLDFFVVVTMWIGVIYSAASGEDAGGGSSAARIIRALRPLKLLKSFEELKNIMAAFSEAVPFLITVSSLLLFFFVLFGTMGVNLFGGALTRVCEVHGNELACTESRDTPANQYVQWNCTDLEIVSDCPSSLNCEFPNVCRAVPGTPPMDGSFRADENQYIGFNNLLVSFLTIFVVTTGDEWPAVSYAIRDSHANVGFIVWPFLAVITFILAMVTAELFTAVIAFAFNAEGEENENGGSILPKSPIPLPPTQEVLRQTLSGAIAEEQEEKTDYLELKPFPFVPGVSSCCHSVIRNQMFDITTITIIVLNGICMGFEHYDGQEMVLTPLWIEIVFICTYTVELCIRILGTGVVPFYSGESYGFNIIDSLVVVFGVLGLVLNVRGSGVLRVLRIIFRAMRVLRMAKLFSRSRMLTAILHTVFGSVEAFLNLMVFITFSLFIASILGMHLFGFECHTDDTGDPLPIDRIPRTSFASFGRGLLASFQVMTGEDWGMIMYHYMHCYGPSAAIFFCLLFVYTNWILKTMFVAVILKNFELDEEDKILLQHEQFLNLGKTRPPNEFREWLSRRSNPPKTFSEKAVCCFAERNSLRKLCKATVDAPIFEMFIMFVILVSSITLAAEPPPQQPITNWFQKLDADSSGTLSRVECIQNGGLNGDVFKTKLSATTFAATDADNSTFIEYMEFATAVKDVEVDKEFILSYTDVLHFLDAVVFVIFWVEIILKVIANGAILTEHAYWSDPWNRLDFAVVIGTTVDIILTRLVGMTGIGVRILRAFRVLRPLRLIKHNPGMRVVVNTVIQCMPMVMGVSILIMLVLYVFAVLGVAFFAGLFYRCEPDVALAKVECIALYGPVSWSNPGYSFDSIVDALESLFICTTTEGWVDVMNSGIDATELHQAPVRESQPNMAAFFVTFMVTGSFFLSQLFVGVLCTYFSQSSGSALLTDAQMKWVQLNMLAMQVQSDSIPPPAPQWRKAFYDFVTTPLFDASVNVCIGINVLMMCLERFPQDSVMTEWFEIANLCFVSIFILEMLLKQIGFGPKALFLGPNSFQNAWNSFDCCIVLLSVFSFVAKDFSAIQGARSLRVLRVLLLLKNLSSLKTVFTTLIISIPPTLNIMALLTVLIFVYGVLGVQLYGGLPIGPRINHIDNFDDVQSAMMVLFQIATGEDLLGFLIELRSYERGFVATYFISYYIVAVFLFMNIFIAALLENFEMTFDTDALEIKSTDMVVFKESWVSKMPEEHLKDQRMPFSHMRRFLADLPGVWETSRRDPFWFNVILVELGMDPEHIQDPDRTFGLRQTLLALSAATLENDCFSLHQQVEKASDTEKRRTLMASRLISAAFMAKILIIRTQKQDDLSARQKMWKIMALQFARDACMHSILNRSKVASIADEGFINRMLALAEMKADDASAGDDEDKEDLQMFESEIVPSNGAGDHSKMGVTVTGIPLPATSKVGTFEAELPAEM
jgi:voltage-dependent calcium channel L type alpha-1D